MQFTESKFGPQTYASEPVNPPSQGFVICDGHFYACAAVNLGVLVQLACAGFR